SKTVAEGGSMYEQSSGSASLIMALQTVGLPVLWALVGIGLQRWLVGPQAQSGSKLAQSPAPLLLGAALAAGFWVSAGWIRGSWGLPPAQAMDVLVLAPWLLLAGEWAWARLGFGLRVLLALLLSAGLVVWMLWPILSRGTVLEALGAVMLVLVLFALPYISLQAPKLAQQQALFWLAGVALAAPIVALDGTLLLAQLCGVLASLLGVLWLASLLPLGLGSLRLLGPGMALLLYCAAYFYADIHPLALALPALGVGAGALLSLRWGCSNRLVEALRTLVLGGVATAAAAWLVWPQGSMY
ncbi:MAG TPA: hypothetical protein VIS52_04970, partial [Motiliproteus sp.]